MPSIFPETTAGGLVVRTQAGACQSPPAVERAYCPPAAFAASCDITALPSDCTARIEPRQLNAIVSELVSFAECLDPSGPWNCGSMHNLCLSFQTWWAWAQTQIAGVYIGDVAPANPTVGMMWYESDTGNTYIYYNDGNSTQWVQMAPGASGGGNTGITDAPSDGQQYGRQDANWSVINQTGLPLGGTVGQALVTNLTGNAVWGYPIDCGTF